MLIIQTQRLSLVEVECADASFILELVNTPSWKKYIGDRGINSVADASLYIENSFIKSYQENGFGLYKIIVTNTQKPVGLCGLVNRPTLPNVDIGFALLPKYEGLGYGFEAAQATMNFAATALKLTPILGITIPENKASRRLLEKIGLRFVETQIKENGEELMVYST